MSKKEYSELVTQELLEDMNNEQVNDLSDSNIRKENSVSNIDGTNDTYNAKNGILEVSEKITKNNNINEENLQYSIDNKSNLLENKFPVSNKITEKDNIRTTAQRYFDMTKDKSKKLVETIERFQETRNKNATNGSLKIVFDDTIKGNGIITKDTNGNRLMRINPNSDKSYEFIAVHEMTHDLEGTAEYKELQEVVKEFTGKGFGYEQARADLEKRYNEFYEKNGLDKNELNIESEAMSDILGTVLGDQKFINEVSRKKPNVAKRIINWIDRFMDIHKSKGVEREFKEYLYKIKDSFKKAFEANNIVNNENIDKYTILTNNKNQKYVKADRQVISGNDYLKWEEQVENYINEKIRKGQDVNVLTDDGEVLTITENTAGKAKFRNEIIDKNGNKRRLNKSEFQAKLRAETHIDELAEVSKYKNGPVADTKNHSFARDGFTYRTAYFEDVDGKYYKITMSIGKNGDLNTIYNIGKMQKNRRYSISELKGSSGKTTSDRISPTNSIAPTEAEVNTTNKYYIQENKNDTQRTEKNKKGDSYNKSSFSTSKNSKDKSLWEDFMDYLDKKEPNKERTFKKDVLKSEVNKFNGYTEKEIRNIESDKIFIAKNKEDINNFVMNARKKSNNTRIFLSKVSKNIADKIKSKLGLNIDNYNISLKNDDVRKIFKDHGSELTEIPRGQVPITMEDFQNIPDIINNPDNVSIAGESPQGKTVLKFEKNIQGNNIVITYISDKNKNLEMQTMYKFKKDKKNNSFTALYENKTPRLNTSKMDSDTSYVDTVDNVSTTNNIIHQKEADMQDIKIISYQNIIGNYNISSALLISYPIISYQNIIGNYNNRISTKRKILIISYQNIIGNYNIKILLE